MNIDKINQNNGEKKLNDEVSDDKIAIDDRDFDEDDGEDEKANYFVDKDQDGDEDDESGEEDEGNDNADEDDEGDDNKDEDDDQNFIKKDDPEEKREEVFQDIKSDLDAAVEDLEVAKNGVRPEGNQQRNLDRETGGVEAEQDLGISEKDAWDDRGAEIIEMIQDGRDLNNASRSSRAQGFIHVAKQRKLQEKHNEAAGATLGHVAKLMQWRKNTENDMGQGGGSPLI